MTPKRAVLACVLMLGFADLAVAGDFKAGVAAHYVGQGTCMGWNVADREGGANSAQVNWVLGFLYGRAAYRKRDFRVPIDTAEVWNRIDRKCRSDPRKQIGTVAYEIERELLARR
ncbi:hypothetical protein [Phenylobacterium sp.]|uniref:hypothetical protein n=1 Tax=Phenylobacterium sp. TaxID=1871053 RepID=UPI0035AF0496